MGRPTHSSSSSIDSTTTPDDDLTLALTISPPLSTQISREQRLDWPPIKPNLWTTLAHNRTRTTAASLFVKVYMEGIPIGRKLDLLAHHGYHALITALARMFKTNILWPNADRVHSEKHHVLTYEDKEGDWLLVGDVPWEMFLNTVTRLKITRADRC